MKRITHEHVRMLLSPSWDVAVNKEQNKMDVAVGKVPWHNQDSEEEYKRYRARGRHCGVELLNDHVKR